MGLRDALQDPKKRGYVVDDCAAMLDTEVAHKGGLSGMVIKTGYKAVKGIRPGFIRKAIELMMDEWAEKLDPIWQEAQKTDNPTAYFSTERSRVAEALLEITDARAQRAESKLARSTYEKLRPNAKKNVEEAVPALAKLFEKHAS